LFVRKHSADDRIFYLNNPMAVRIISLDAEHKNAKAIPFDLISPENYEQDKYRIIRAREFTDKINQT